MRQDYSQVKEVLDISPAYRITTIVVGITCVLVSLGYAGYQVSYVVMMSNDSIMTSYYGIGGPAATPHFAKVLPFAIGIIEACLCMLFLAPIGAAGTVFAIKRKPGKRWMWITVLIATVIMNAIVLATRGKLANFVMNLPYKDKQPLIRSHIIAIGVGVCTSMAGFGTYFVFFFMKKARPPMSPSPLLADDDKVFTTTPFPSPQDIYTFSSLQSSPDSHSVLPGNAFQLNGASGDGSPQAPSRRISEITSYDSSQVATSVTDSAEYPTVPQGSRNTAAGLPPLLLATKGLWQRSRSDDPVSATTPPPYSRLWGPSNTSNSAPK
ncbi:uncharacterized protein LOC62_06G007839 [Vanrija pseudolonga]|uniref:Uncharacterized protein n=1 Tax=Vanrija pseudolonga TaxID=143232 RepID=A0AAF0YCQ8_9TREE|nr:hypothetical protein LOC62_06G007839 [Vanrija pseudolonga]